MLTLLSIKQPFLDTENCWKKKKKLILHPKNPINLTESIELETSFECIFTNEIESKWKAGVKPQHSNIVALNLIKKISETK